MSNTEVHLQNANLNKDNENYFYVNKSRRAYDLGTLIKCDVCNEEVRQSRLNVHKQKNSRCKSMAVYNDQKKEPEQPQQQLQQQLQQHLQQQPEQTKKQNKETLKMKIEKKLDEKRTEREKMVSSRDTLNNQIHEITTKIYRLSEMVKVLSEDNDIVNELD